MKTEDLIASSIKGNLEAFDELVVLYQDRVYTHCLHLCGNIQDAEDLAQEVFLQAYRKLNLFRGEADFGTWLHRIAVNLRINQQRKENKVVFVSYDEPLSTKDSEITRQLISPESSPQEVFEHKEKAYLVQEALMQLPEDYRNVLVLRELDGLSYDQISEVLNCSLGTVKSRISRGRKILKDILLKNFNDEIS